MLSAKSSASAILVYMVAVAIAPYFAVGGYSLRVELLLFSPVCLFLFFNRSLIEGTAAEVGLCTVGLLFVVLAFSLISVVGGETFNPIGAFFYVRYFALILALSMASGAIPNGNAVWSGTVATLALASILQFSGADWFRTILEKYYSSSVRASGLDGLANLSSSGLSLRSYGFLESPTWAGVFFGIAFYLALSTKGMSGKVAMISSLIGGMLSVSSSFFALLVIVIALWAKSLLLNWRYLVGLMLLILVVTLFVVNFDEGISGGVSYQIERLATLQVLDSRYSSSGNIRGAFNFSLLGAGTVVERSLFVGDSIYLVVLHDFGIVFGPALLLFLLFVYAKIGGRVGVTVWGLLMVVGLGSATFFIPRSADLLLLGVLIKKCDR